MKKILAVIALVLAWFIYLGTIPHKEPEGDVLYYQCKQFYLLRSHIVIDKVNEYYLDGTTGVIGGNLDDVLRKNLNLGEEAFVYKLIRGDTHYGYYEEGSYYEGGLKPEPKQIDWRYSKHEIYGFQSYSDAEIPKGNTGECDLKPITKAQINTVRRIGSLTDIRRAKLLESL